MDQDQIPASVLDEPDEIDQPAGGDTDELQDEEA